MPRFSTQTIALMGTRLSIVLPGTGKDNALEAAVKEAKSIEQLLNRHNPDSPLAQLNAGKACKDIELINVLKQCLHHKNQTLGCFDVNVAKLMALWKIEHGHMKAKLPPDKKQITEELQKKNREDQALASALTKGAFPKGQTFSIDLGGYAKGYALDRMIERLKAQDVRDAFISFGESSITGLGHHPAGDTWPVSVSTQGGEMTIKLSDESISISGAQKQAAKYGHIINPITGIAVPGHGMAIVKAPSATVAEVLSTALQACTDSEKQKTIVDNYPDCTVKYFA